MINLEGKKLNDTIFLPVQLSGMTESNDNEFEKSVDDVIRRMCTMLPVSEIACRGAMLAGFRELDMSPDAVKYSRARVDRLFEENLFRIVPDDVSKGQIRAAVDYFLENYFKMV